MIAELFLITMGCIITYVLNALQPAEKQPLVFIPEAIKFERQPEFLLSTPARCFILMKRSSTFILHI